MESLVVTEVEVAREFVKAATEFQVGGDKLAVFIRDKSSPSDWMTFSFSVGREIAKKLIREENAL